MVSSFLSAVWASSLAYQFYIGQFYVALLATETLCNLGWIAVILCAIKPVSSFRQLFLQTHLGTVAVVTGVLSIFSEVISLFDVLVSPQILFGLHLLQSILGLLLLEHLFRQVHPSARYAVKPLCLGLGVMFGYGFVLYADSLLTSSVSATYWEARGWVTLLTIPLVLMSARRINHWSVRVFVSRTVVYSSTILLVAGGYLLVMALVGYYVKHVGGSWGGMAQHLLFSVGVLLLVSLFLSQSLRRRTKVFIAKHFFANRYEYREEWIKFSQIMSGQGGSPFDMSLHALMRPFACQYGVLLVYQNGYWTVKAEQGTDKNNPDIENVVLHFGNAAHERNWIFDLATEREPGDGQGDHPFQIVVPLGMGDIKALCLLSRPQTTSGLDWEDRDLMRAISSQLNVHLNLHFTNQALAETRQFEAFNQMSAFLVHDLKNVLAQLQLITRNAARHRDNPEFIDDTFETVEAASSRLNRVLSQLRQKLQESSTVERVELSGLLKKVCEERAVQKPEPVFSGPSEPVLVSVTRDKVHNIFGHLIQNAQDATDNSGSVSVVLKSDGREAVICVEDSGCGMSESFIENRLFTPFDTTKGNAGMGIGAYEVRKVVESLGGRVDVMSTPGLGTRFTVSVPVMQQQEILSTEESEYGSK